MRTCRIIADAFAAESASEHWPYYHLRTMDSRRNFFWAMVVLSLMSSLRNLRLRTGHIIIDGFAAEFASGDWSY